MKSFKLILVLFISIVTNNIFAQNDSVKQAIIKHNGIEQIGYIISDDGREILFNSDALGKIYILKSDIRKIIQVDNEKLVKYGELRTAGPFTTRYIFTNNALPIVKGENYTMLNIYGPEVHFAVSNNLNIGIMTTWIASPLVLA